MPPIEIGPLPPGAVGELLTLQRAAYVTEAQLYDDVRLPALVQTLDDLADELAGSTCLAVLAGSRLVGAVRREVTVPLIASGGAGAVEHFPPAVEAGADAVLAASVFHFGQLRVGDVKEALAEAGVPVRREVDHPLG